MDRRRFLSHSLAFSAAGLAGGGLAAESSPPESAGTGAVPDELAQSSADVKLSSESVSHQPPGPGAKLTTVAAKLAETSLSVIDFGAKGDGSTDDTASIQAALDFAEGKNRSVYLPFKERGYRVTHLVVPSRVRLWSDVTGYFKQGSWNPKSQTGQVTWLKSAGPVSTPTITMHSGSTVEGLLLVDPRQKFALEQEDEPFNDTQYGIQLGDERSLGKGVMGVTIRDVGFVGHTKFVVQYKDKNGKVPVIANLYLQRIHGAVFGTGVEIYHTADVCWAYDVQFNMNALRGVRSGDRALMSRAGIKRATAFKLGRADGFNIVAPQVMHCRHFIHFFPYAYNGDKNKGGGCRVLNGGIDVVHVPIYIEGRSNNAIGLLVSNCFMLPLFAIPGAPQAALVLKNAKNFNAQLSNIALSRGGARSFSKKTDSKYFGRDSVKLADYAVYFEGDCADCHVNISTSTLSVRALANDSGTNSVQAAACTVSNKEGPSEQGRKNR